MHLLQVGHEHTARMEIHLDIAKRGTQKGCAEHALRKLAKLVEGGRLLTDSKDLLDETRARHEKGGGEPVCFTLDPPSRQKGPLLSAPFTRKKVMAVVRDEEMA